MQSRFVTMVAANALLAHITFLCFGGLKDAVAQTWPVIDKEVRAKYYRLLDSCASDSSIDQIAVLQNFLSAHPDFERAYVKLSECCLVHQKIQEAQKFFQALAARSSHGHNSHWMLAKICVDQQNFPQAEKEFSQALQASRFSFSLLRDFLEFAYEQSGKAEEPAALRSLKLHRSIRKLILAFLDYQRGAYVQALEIFREIPLEISHDMAVLHFWGQCYYRIPRYAQADSLWRIGLVIARRENDWEMEAQFLTNLGIIARLSHAYNLAGSYYDSAYVIASRLDDVHRKQILAGNRGNIQLDQGNYLQAVEYYKTAIAQASQIRAYSYSTFWYNSYGVILVQLGQYYEALQAYEESERLAQRMNNLTRFIELKIDRADVYYTLNQYEVAKAIYQEAYELADKFSLPKQKYFALDRLADLKIREKAYGTARALIWKYIHFLHQRGDMHRISGCLPKLAATYEAECRYGLAKTYYERAARVAQQVKAKVYEASYRLQIADLEMLEGRADIARPIYEHALEIANAENNLTMLAQIYYGLGEVYQKTDNLAKAITSYTRAAVVIEEARQKIMIEQLRIGFFSTRLAVYGKLVQCYLRRYETDGQRSTLDSLWRYEEMSRSRALQDLEFREKTNTAHSTGYLHDHEYLKACAQLRWLQRRLRQKANTSRPTKEWDHLLAQLEAARLSLVTQRLRLVKADSIAGQLRSEPVRHLSTILQGLKHAGLGLLQYHISNETAFVLAAVDDSVRIVQLQLQPSSLAATIDSLMTPFHISGNGASQQVQFRADIAHRLYRSLVEPAEAALKLPPRLLIVPDLAVTNLPFEMLLVKTPPKAVYMPFDLPDYDQDFLLHRYKIVYSPSAFMFEERPTAVSSYPTLLVLANPFANTTRQKIEQSYLRAATGWSFDPLPFSETEAKRIAEVYPSARVYKRDEATKTLFLQEAAQQQMMHIASHAFVDTTFDAFSGLVLATSPDSTDDGMLMGYEIADLNMNCDLLTLSACETGRGKVVVGEGVLGMPRLFLGAGAKTVLMTLWKVDDRFASELMPAFYENYLGRKMSKAESLAEAKRLMLVKQRTTDGYYYGHPFYWASFVLYGDPGGGSSRESLYSGPKFVLAIITVLLCASILLIYQWHAHRDKHPKLTQRWSKPWTNSSSYMN